MRQEKLDQLIASIPLMKEMVDEDIAITIWDRSATTLYFAGADSFPLHFDIGFTIPDPNDKIFLAMETGKTIHNALPREIFGIAIEGNLVPVFDEGKVVGCITCVFSVEDKYLLNEQTEAMKSTIDHSKHALETIFNTAKKTRTYLNDMQHFIANLKLNVKDVLTNAQSIKQTSRSTKILAINTSIEAARANEAGVGFGFVAKEMGRLSEVNAQSVTQIEGALNILSDSMNAVDQTLEELSELTAIDDISLEDILKGLNL